MPGLGNVDTAPMQELAKLTFRQRKLQTELKDVTDQIKDLNKLIGPAMAAAGVSSVNIDGAQIRCRTETKVWPKSGVVRDGLVNYLKSTPQFSGLVKEGYQHGSLQSAVKDALKNDCLPADIKEWVVIEDFFIPSVYRR